MLRSPYSGNVQRLRDGMNSLSDVRQAARTAFPRFSPHYTALLLLLRTFFILKGAPMAALPVDEAKRQGHEA
jgi:hypothetical protein